MSSDYIIKACELHRYIERGECSPQGVEKMWRQAFSCALKHLGFTRKQRSYLWCELASGNWERLHLTAAEAEISADEWLDQFSWDVFYCSDRWSFDRVTRCHWMFRQYMQAATGKYWWPGRGY